MLFKRLCEIDTIQQAWQRVLGHYSKDDTPEDLREFDRRRDHNLETLSHMLQNQSFIPEPAAVIEIPKPLKPGESRPITLVKLEDRIVLTALAGVLEPVFEPQFSPNSFAYRRNRGALDAVRSVERCIRQTGVNVACADIDSFFDTVDRSRLMEQISRSIWEKPILRLLDLYLSMAHAAKQQWVESKLGIAQGSPLSPLLANVYLIDFDRFLDESKRPWIRFADDFVLFGGDNAEMETAVAETRGFLREKLGLQLNPNIQYSTPEKGFDFLGFHFERGRRRISQAKLDGMQTTLVQEFQRNSPSFLALAQSVSQTVEGWTRYYGHGDTANQFAQLEMFLGFQVVRRLRESLSQGEKTKLSKDDRDALARIPLLVGDSPERRRIWLDGLIEQAEREAATARRAPRVRPERPSPEARRALAKRKQEFLERKFDLEEIVITRPGMYLGRSGERLVIRKEGEKLGEAPLSTLKNITFVTTAASLSVDLMAECADRGIGIQVLGTAGRPLSVAGNPETPSYLLSLRQSELAAGPSGLNLAKTLVLGKIENQMRLLKYFAKYKKRRSTASTDFGKEAVGGLELMNRIAAELSQMSLPEAASESELDLIRGRLFAAEGRAAGHYWNAARVLIAGHALFECRVRKGARDKVNSLLNYGYGILYSRMLPLLLRAGLNPYIGFLHKPQAGKAGLLFDMIEEFRTSAVDRVVFSLLNKQVEIEITDLGLAPESRALLARAVIRRLQTGTRFNGAVLPLQKIMEVQVKKLVEAIEGKTGYEPYAMPW